MELQRKINQIATQYAENYVIYTSLSDRLFQIEQYDEWLSVLKERSDTLRRIFQDNEKVLDELREILDQLDLDSSKKVYLALFGVFFDKFRQTDFPVLINIAERILPFFEEIHDYDRIVRLCSALVFWTMEYYGRQTEQIGREETIAYARKVLQCAQYYRDMQDKEARIRLFRTYSNLIGAIVDIYHPSFSDVYAWYQEALGLWNSDCVQEMDGEDRDFLDEIAWLQDCFLDYCYDQAMKEYRVAGDSEHFRFCLDFLRKSLVDLDKTGAEDNGILERSKYLCDFIEHNKTGEQIVDDIALHLTEIPSMDFVQYSDEENLILLDEFMMTIYSFFGFLELSELTLEARKERVRVVMGIVNAQIRSIPGNVYSDFVNSVLADIFRLELPYLSTLEEKISELQRLIIYRQPMTYIHCYMVELLAIEVAEELLKRSPDFFVGLPGFSSAREVLDKKDVLLEYIRCCGILHDIGKCKIAGVINMHTRRLTDLEFQCIRMHPQFGRDLFAQDEEFLPFLPIILGHHKSYDGKSGYPASFQNCQSPYRHMIDLISICDCLDAATDIYGRNYAKGKTFLQVLDELIQGAGTRYNSDIVNVIASQPALKERLSYLTTEGRSQAYYAAFSRCKALNE